MSGARPRVLIFGRTGQVGRELCALLEGAEFEVTALDREDCDLTSEGDAAKAVAKFQPQFIVNAAAYTAVDRAEAEPETAERVNAAAVAEIAAAAKAHHAILIHYSTDYVFDGSSTRPWREEDATAPLNSYGRTKLRGEKAIADSGATAFVFRTSWVYAAEGVNFLRTMIRMGAEREELSVVGDQIGAPTRALDLASLTIHTLRRFTGKSGTIDAKGAAKLAGLYHASARGETSWHGFAEAIFEDARALGMPVKVKSVNSIRTKDWNAAAERPLYSVLDSTKLEKKLAFAMPEWREALRLLMKDLAGRTH